MGRKFKVVLAGGGTGGHIYPALAIAGAVKELEPSARFLYIGTETGLEAELVPRASIPFEVIKAGGAVGKSPVQAVRGLAAAAAGVRRSRSLLKQFRPRAVVGTGGYAALPVGLAAALGRVPLIIHEQNAVPSVTNRILSRWARVTAVPFADTERAFPGARRIEVTGNPVRRAVLDADKEEARRRLGLAGFRHAVLVTSGSRGARTINEAAAELARRLPDGTALIWITGRLYYDGAADRLDDAFPGSARKLLRRDKVPGRGAAGGADSPGAGGGGASGRGAPGGHPFTVWGDGAVLAAPYYDTMELALAAADLAVCRAGGLTLAEVTARGLPAVIIPSPNVTHNHQEENAAVLARAGAAAVIADAACTGERLTEEVLGLLAHRERRMEMAAAGLKLARPRAAEDLARLVLGVGNGGDGHGR